MNRYITKVIRYYNINGERKEAGVIRTYNGPWQADNEEKAERLVKRCEKLGLQVFWRTEDTQKELMEWAAKNPRATYAGVPGDKCFGNPGKGGIKSGFGADMYY